MFWSLDNSGGLLDFLTDWSGGGEDWLDFLSKPDSGSLNGLFGFPKVNDNFLTRFLTRPSGGPPTYTPYIGAQRSPTPVNRPPTAPVTQVPSTTGPPGGLTLPSITARFGETGPHWRAGHRGVDFSVGMGTPINPIDVGVVERAGWDDELGNYVVVRHEWGTSLYGHGSALLSQVGQPAVPGQPVMLSGTSGLSEGPHLHLETEVGGQAVDPMALLQQRALSESALFGRRPPSLYDEDY